MPANMDNDAVYADFSGLEQFVKLLKAKLPVARVGILGASVARPNSPLTNADIGAIHEYGSFKHPRIPKRSFLWTPLTERLNTEIEATKGFNDELLKETIKEGSFVKFMNVIAKIGERIVLGAFATGGYGQWPAHAPGYTNNTGMLLVDTTQLRDSITSDVTRA